MSKNSNPKVVVIVGPTASGKSDLAVSIAKRFNGEVISADSRQVYRGLNIGSGKITKREMKGVPHHMLDIADPKKVYNASDFKRDGEAIAREIMRLGKTPIICGGTGFYIATLLGEMSIPEVPPNKKLRSLLKKKSIPQLIAILKKLDSKRLKTIDQKNPVRLIRAIEIAKALGKVPPIKKSKKYDVLKIGLLPSLKEMEEKIKKRLDARMRQGMVAEAKKLHKQGLSFKRMEELGLEYRYLAKFLKGEISREEMLQELNLTIFQYAKRQLTWFRKDKEIQWFNLKEKTVLLKEIEKYLPGK